MKSPTIRGIVILSLVLLVSSPAAVAFIRQHHARITNLHLKDRKKDHGPNTPWGEGDTPLKDVLLLLKKEKYGFPANIELEYRVPEGSDAATEVAKCLKYCRDILS